MCCWRGGCGAHGPTRPSAGASSSTGSGCGRWRTRCRTSCRAASSSASRSPARWSTTRPCCSPTSRRATSTSRRAPKCSACCGRAPTKAGRSSSSPTRTPPPPSPTACCGSSTAAWWPREAAGSPSDGRRGGRVRRRRWLAAAGVAAASLVVGTAATVGYGLATGFDRAARDADLPDVVARFDRERRATLDARVRALPNLQAASYRTEVTGVDLVDGHGHFLPRGVVHVVLGGRRGYAITDGRDLSPRPGEVVVERGLAREWGLLPGDPLTLAGLGDLRVAGIALSPDNVAFPLARAARVYVGEQEVRDAFHFRGEIRPDLALLWLNDPARADVTLTQARAVSFGLGSLSFVTREGVRVLLSQAAGIIISLLVAFSLVALLAAGVMLAAGAHADVQRRLGAIGVQRALGFTPVGIAARQAREAALVALPAAVAGLAVGALAVAGPSAALLGALNEQPPGTALLA